MAAEPEILLGLIEFLLKQLESTLHMRDSAVQALQELPEWQTKLRAQMENPLRQQHTDETLVQPIQNLIIAAAEAEGPVSAELLAQVTRKLKPPLQ